MKVYKNFNDLASGIGKKYCRVVEASERWQGMNYMYVDDIEVMTHIRGNDIHFVVFDVEDNNDCKEYMLEYEVHEYDWKVYVDDVEGWQKCRVVDMKNTKMEIDRATIICESGTQLNRVVKFVFDEDDDNFEADGCIYQIEKE